jgi:hypothetical protein
VPNSTRRVPRRQKFRTERLRSRVSSLESRVSSPGPRVPSPASRVPSLKSQVRFDVLLFTLGDGPTRVLGFRPHASGFRLSAFCFLLPASRFRLSTFDFRLPTFDYRLLGAPDRSPPRSSRRSSIGRMNPPLPGAADVEGGAGCSAPGPETRSGFRLSAFCLLLPASDFRLSTPGFPPA